MATPFETFVTTELPRRVALLTKEMCGGYEGDPNDPGAPSILQNAPKGTFYLRNSDDVLWRKRATGTTTWVAMLEGGGAAERGTITTPGGTWQFTASWAAPLIGYTPVWEIDGNYTSWIGAVTPTSFIINTSTILPPGKTIYWAALGGAGSIGGSNLVVDCAWAYAGPTPQTFTTPTNFIPGTTLVYFNGQRLKLGALKDYTETAANVVQLNAGVVYDPAEDEITIDYLEA